MTDYPADDLKTRGAKEVIFDAKIELEVAIRQMTDRDDRIICDHVRKARALLSLIITH